MAHLGLEQPLDPAFEVLQLARLRFDLKTTTSKNMCVRRMAAVGGTILAFELVLRLIRLRFDLERTIWENALGGNSCGRGLILWETKLAG